MRGPAASPDLRPSYDVLDKPSLALPAQPGPARLTTGGEQATKENLDELLATDQATRDLNDGRVNPHLYSVERAAEELLNPTWSMVEGDRDHIGRVGTSTAAFMRQLGRQYLRGIKDYMKLPDEQRRNPLEPRAEVLEIYERMRRAAEEGAERLTCLVCVALAAGTMEPRVSRSSGRRPFDRLAVEAVRKAVRSRDTPEDLEPVRACYEVQARFHRVPPLPYAGCSFDEVKLKVGCFYPFKKVLSKSVKLVSIRPIAPSGH